LARSQTSIWKTIKVKSQREGAETHLSHAMSANAYGPVVIGTCSFPLNSESIQAWLAAKPARSRHSTRMTRTSQSNRRNLPKDFPLCRPLLWISGRHGNGATTHTIMWTTTVSDETYQLEGHRSYGCPTSRAASARAAGGANRPTDWLSQCSYVHVPLGNGVLTPHTLCQEANSPWIRALRG
jgi:hypothetical protein